jgi:hypothetical protein
LVVQLFRAVLFTRFQLSDGVLRIQVRLGVLRVPESTELGSAW